MLCSFDIYSSNFIKLQNHTRMKRIFTLTLFIGVLLVLISSNAYSQIGRLRLSPSQKLEQNIAKTDITIEYSRPNKRDRVIFGDLVPYNEYWRTGANENTTIEFNQDVIIQGARVKKGKYAIITKPNIDSWEVLLYNETTNWKVPETLDSTKIVCTVKADVEALNKTVETFTIYIGDFTNYEFDLVFMWDKTAAILPIDLTTKETMAKLISNEIDGPQAGDYFSAAVYQLESEKDFEQGLEWINKAIEIREKDNKPAWYDYWKKALLLIELERFDEIEPVVEKGLKLAELKKNELGLEEFAKIKKMLAERK